MAESTEFQFQLTRAATVLRQQAWLIALVTALAVGVAVVVVATQSTVHRASTKIVVGQGNGLFQPQFGGSVEPFTRTMTSLLESEVVARGVIRQLRLDTTPTELLARLNVVTSAESSVLEVQYDTTEKEEAVRVLSAIGAEFTCLVRTRLNNAGGSDAGGPPITATVFDPPTLAAEPVAPRPLRTYVVAIVLGLALGVTFAFIRDSLDRKIRSVIDAELAFHAPVLGVMPRVKGQRDRPLGLEIDSHVMHMLGANVQFLREGGYGPVFVVTSALANEGKTTVSASLAAALAVSGKRVVCVDADLHRPRLASYLGAAPDGPGVAEVLSGAVTLEAALQRVFVRPRNRSRGAPNDVSTVRTMPTTMEVYLLRPGSPRRDPSTYDSDFVEGLYERLQESFDYVVVDTPPVLLAADAFPFVRAANTVVVAAREGRTRRESAEAVAATLGKLGVTDPFVVLTDSTLSTEHYGYGMAYRNWAGDEGSDARQLNVT